MNMVNITALMSGNGLEIERCRFHKHVYLMVAFEFAASAEYSHQKHSGSTIRASSRTIGSVWVIYDHHVPHQWPVSLSKSVNRVIHEYRNICSEVHKLILITLNVPQWPFKCSDIFSTAITSSHPFLEIKCFSNYAANTSSFSSCSLKYFKICCFSLCLSIVSSDNLDHFNLLDMWSVSLLHQAPRTSADFGVKCDHVDAGHSLMSTGPTRPPDEEGLSTM